MGLNEIGIKSEIKRLFYKYFILFYLQVSENNLKPCLVIIAKGLRSHSELGSQVLQPMVLVLRHGRVGRCQAKNYESCKLIKIFKERDLNSKLVKGEEKSI